MGLYGNPQLSGVERKFDPRDLIVSKTDRQGKITYGNRTFFELAGYDEKHCIGAPHNIVRNPNMPRCVFDLLWDTLKGGKEIFAYVVNRSANGDHYWVFAHVTPSYDAGNEIVGYHSNRRVPDATVLREHIIPLYDDLLQVEKSAASPSGGMQAARDKIENKLSEARMGFNEFMFSLGV